MCVSLSLSLSVCVCVCVYIYVCVRDGACARMYRYLDDENDVSYTIINYSAAYFISSLSLSESPSVKNVVQSS